MKNDKIIYTAKSSGNHYANCRRAAKQKVKSRAIRSYMHKKGYDRLLIIGPYTPHTLKVKITTWRYFPKFYRFV